MCLQSVSHTQLIPVEALVCQASGLELAEAVLEEGEGAAVEVILGAVCPDPLQSVDCWPGPAQSLHPVLPLKLIEGLKHEQCHLIGLLFFDR